jgi:hypothetical protein
MFWGWDCQWRNAGRPPRPTMTTTTTTNVAAPPQDAPLPFDLLDLLRQDVLTLFLVDNALSLTSTSTAVGRGRPDDTPLLLSLYDYYAVLILARFPPRELSVADGGKDNGSNDNDNNACSASVAVRNLGIQPNKGLIIRFVPRTLSTMMTMTSDGIISVRGGAGDGGARGQHGGLQRSGQQCGGTKKHPGEADVGRCGRRGLPGHHRRAGCHNDNDNNGGIRVVPSNEEGGQG